MNSILPRDTAKRVIAKRITAPETQTDPKTQKKIPLLSFIDPASYQRHIPTTKDIFLYAAGSSSTAEGEIPDGLDRLLHHEFIVHVNANEKAIGLDVIPSRLYRSGVKPVSQKDVKTLVVTYLLNGAVARVTQRPFNTRFEQSAAVIRALDDLIRAGKPITTTTRLGSLGHVVSVQDNAVEVRLRPEEPKSNRENADDLDDDDDIAESTTGETSSDAEGQ